MKRFTRAVLTSLTAAAALATTGPTAVAAGNDWHAPRTDHGTPPGARTASTAATLPSTCISTFDRVRGSQWSFYRVAGQTLRSYSVGQFTFGTTPEQPRLMTFVDTAETSSAYVDRYVSIRDDGSAWLQRVIYSRTTGAQTGITSTRLVASGFANAKTIAGGHGHVYVTTTAGALRRYTLTSTNTLSGTRSLATSGWSTITTMDFGGWGTVNGAVVEDFVAITSAGALAEYRFTMDGKRSGAILKSRSWGGFAALSIGACASTSMMRSIVGITPAGDAYAYSDTNGYDLKGADISGSGKVASGLTPLVF